MCKLDPKAIALTTGIVSGILALACIGLVAWDARAFMAALGYLIHADLAALARPLTPGSVIAGLLFWTLAPAGIAAAAASLYNRLVPEARLMHAWAPEEQAARARSER
ncbi:MAG: hypothetical protein FJZ01_24135 [Candidatus Sericytochromatia bacterium]|nr:hypothetical protein [Candidatus Tanganyikabacteria bacterium]